MDKKVKTPQELVSEAQEKIHKAIEDAVKLSDEHGLSFGIYPAYGMGEHYVPKPKIMSKNQALALIESGKELTDKERKEAVEAIRNNCPDEMATADDWGSSNYGWMASSQGC